MGCGIHVWLKVLRGLRGLRVLRGLTGLIWLRWLRGLKGLRMLIGGSWGLWWPGGFRVLSRLRGLMGAHLS